MAYALVLVAYHYFSFHESSKEQKRLLSLFLTPRRTILNQVYKRYFLKISKNKGDYIEFFKTERSDNLCETINRVFHTPRAGRGALIIATPQLIDSFLGRFIRSMNFATCARELLNSLKVLILDEVHTFYIGDVTTKVLRRYFLSGNARIPIIIGLTATPTKESIELLGELIFTKNSKELMREGILTRNLKLISYKTLVKNLRPLKGVQQEIKKNNEWKYAIAERAKKYANAIVKELMKIMEEASLTRIPKTVVASANTREANLICRYLRKYLGRRLNILESPEVVDVVHYRIRKNRSQEIIEKFTLRDSGILVSVRMVDIGFNDPNLEVLVLARPVLSPVAYAQLRGRVLRKTSLKNNIKNKLGYAVIIDLVGRKGIKYLEREVPRVELGRYNEEEIRRASRELAGMHGTVPLARADVNLLKEGEVQVVSDNGSKSEWHKNILGKLRKRYEFAVIGGNIHIRRVLKHTVDELIVDVASTAFREYVEKFMKELVPRDLKSMKVSLTDSEVNALIEKLINELMRALPLPHVSVTPIDTSTQSGATLASYSHSCSNFKKLKHAKNVIKSYVDKALEKGSVSFEHNSHNILLLIRTSSGKKRRKYLRVYVDGTLIASVRVGGNFSKIAKKVLHVLNNSIHSMVNK